MRHPLFAKTKYFIFDMDGTFYLGDRMIPGAGDFARSLAAKGLDYRFFTNNSSNSEETCMAKLANMGFPVEPGRVVLSSGVAADYLNARCPGARVYLLGNGRLAADMRRAGITLVQEEPDLVLLGFDTTLDYEKITKAANWIAAGLPYYATHPDRNCPVTGGFLPDTGSMIALFEASAGRRPVVLGKPMRTTVDYLTRLLRCAPEELAFVGDRLETDIAIAAGHGIPSALVLTGVTTLEDYRAQTQVKAGLVVASMAELGEYV
ncbi:MAG: HAD-IIA family hydrolase [Oscillospiraceae bacterium]|jgi:glycerol-1-phosphate dehydrogenase [NAD(P)+]|nr:HAD-IIA family hydrolase [Oscillospiraceae bacterium]